MGSEMCIRDRPEPAITPIYGPTYDRNAGIINRKVWSRTRLNTRAAQEHLEEERRIQGEGSIGLNSEKAMNNPDKNHGAEAFSMSMYPASGNKNTVALKKAKSDREKNLF